MGSRDAKYVVSVALRGGAMTKYRYLYRLGITPWERYGTAAAASIARLFDREQAERGRPPGRALDLGCGRGQYTPELARRGWDVVGVDVVPTAVEAAKRKARHGETYLVGDVTDLEALELGVFDHFLDVGCFQGLTAEQRLSMGRGVTALAAPGATLLMLAFGPTRWGSILEGTTQTDVEEAYPRWQLLSVEAADTSGLGWPLSTTSPRWYRLGRPPATR